MTPEIEAIMRNAGVALGYWFGMVLGAVLIRLGASPDTMLAIGAAGFLGRLLLLLWQLRRATR